MNDRRCQRCGFVVFERAGAPPPPERCPRCQACGYTETLLANRTRAGRHPNPVTHVLLSKSGRYSS